jgi:hypothetical protein
MYRGQPLTIEASGTLLKNVETGAKLYLTVKYNSLTIVKEEADLCGQLPNVDLNCPLKKGPLNVAKEVEIINQVPKGKYVVTVDVYTESHNEVIICIEGTAVFN